MVASFPGHSHIYLTQLQDKIWEWPGKEASRMIIIAINTKDPGPWV